MHQCYATSPRLSGVAEIRTDLLELISLLQHYTLGKTKWFILQRPKSATVSFSAASAWPQELAVLLREAGAAQGETGVRAYPWPGLRRVWRRCFVEPVLTHCEAVSLALVRSLTVRLPSARIR